jgi:lipopolysaccharide transport system ATP-binding protein
MAADIIQVENLSKMYKLGDINTGTLSHDLKRWWQKLSGKEDPYEKIAEENDRTKKSNSGYVWSLHDINFTVQEGEVFGIIGRNGAGKSTLLRILSKITKPTKGTIRMGGRVASLLEVGTGFHPDLSGRENIFLNGAILGMRKHEIKSRFDEIVNFSGVERYIDTPVKRYSSGMFVRLAFAVAAHLEPEILIIDEVLAVGDAEFQQKCLGKMEDVSRRQGRTVLFVSHNVAAVKRLCGRALLLDKGQTKMIGTVDKVLESYQLADKDVEHGVRNKLPENGLGYFLSWQLEGQSTEDLHSCYTREEFRLVFRFKALTDLPKSEFHVLIRYDDDSVLLHAASTAYAGEPFQMQAGIYELSLKMELPVKRGKYELEAGLLSAGKWIDTWKTSTRINVLDTFENVSALSLTGGLLNVKTAFSLEKISAPIKVPGLTGNPGPLL